LGVSSPKAERKHRESLRKKRTVDKRKRLLNYEWLLTFTLNLVYFSTQMPEIYAHFNPPSHFAFSSFRYGGYRTELNQTFLFGNESHSKMDLKILWSFFPQNLMAINCLFSDKFYELTTTPRFKRNYKQMGKK